MDSAIACVPAPGVPFSRIAGVKGGRSFRPSVMLPPELRMRDGREFSAVVRRGQRARAGNLVVHMDPNRQSTKIGLIVANSVGAAVTRNKVKRRLRHICRQLDFDSGTALVVRALPKSSKASFSQLRRDLQSAVLRAQSG